MLPTYPLGGEVPRGPRCRRSSRSLRGTSSMSPAITSRSEAIAVGVVVVGGVGARILDGGILISDRSGQRQHSNVVLPAGRALSVPHRGHTTLTRPGAGSHVATCTYSGVLGWAIAAATSPSGPRNKVMSANVPRLSAGATVAAATASTSHARATRITGTPSSKGMSLFMGEQCHGQPVVASRHRPTWILLNHCWRTGKLFTQLLLARYRQFWRGLVRRQLANRRCLRQRRDVPFAHRAP
jgi:hypothetical protein